MRRHTAVLWAVTSSLFVLPRENGEQPLVLVPNREGLNAALVA